MILKTFRRNSRRLLLAASALCASLPVVAQLEGPGGFLDNTLTDVIRPALTAADIQGFLPARGLFTFPAPYNTEAIRLTNATDCGGGDCVNYVGYSYWRNINNHVGQDSMLIFLGLDRSAGGAGPTLFEYNKVTDQLSNLGPMFPSASSFSWASGEGWYFSATLPTKVYVGNGGTEVLRYDVLSHQFESVFDITTELGAGVYLWQMHSSDDDRVHSATVRSSSTYAMLGCMAYEEDTGLFHYIPKVGDFDECQIDRSGRWLVIKEDVDGAQGEDNRIIDLATGTERVLLDSDGAAGHSDLGHGYMIAADNWANDANTQKMWRFADAQLSGEVVYSNLDWGIQAPAHVSHTNSRPDLAPEQQYSCGSSANRSDTAHANEIICFPHDGSGDVLVVAPVMTDLNSSGGGDYANSPKGNLDVTGRYFIWTSNTGGSRLDAFLVKVPAGLLTGGAGTPPPAEDTVAPVISGIGTTIITSNSATIAWNTDEPADARIEFGTTSAYGNSTTLDTTLRTGHFQSLQGLAPETQYHYRVISSDASGNIAVSGDRTFTTTALLDTTAPVISSVSAANITADSAVITWTSSEPAENLVEYGMTTAYGDSSVLDNTLSTSHAVNLSGLAPGTLYHYRVHNRDAAGNVASSQDLVFTTSVQEAEPASPAGAITWTDLVNVSVTGGVLQKNSGCDGCPDAGAVSTSQITGTGYLEFTVTADAGLRFIGLSENSAGTGADALNYAFRLQAGMAEVRENGLYRADVAAAAGDVLRISVDNGVVSYSRNGVLLHTSTLVTTGALQADTSFYSMGSSIGQAVMVGEALPEPQPAPQEPLVLAHWALDDASGNTATDASGNGHHGTLKRGPSWMDGVLDGALAFDGNNDFVVIPHADALNAFPLSVSLWVKTGATGLHALVNKYAPGSLNGYQVFVDNGRLCAWYFRDSANYVWDGTGCTLGTAGIADNEWHHVVFTVDAQGGTLYVDGNATATQPWTGTAGATTTTRALNLARYQGTATPYLPGALDDVRLYGNRLGAGDIADAYATIAAPQSGTGPVVWTDLVNVDVSGDVLSKNAGCDGCADAGAASTTQIDGNGYLEFAASALEGLRFIGLSDDTTGTGADTIDFAFRLQGGLAEIRENGIYRGDTVFTDSDVFRITVVDGTVTYSMNGSVLMTSDTAAVNALRADTAFYSMGGNIRQAVIATGITQ